MGGICVSCDFSRPLWNHPSLVSVFLFFFACACIIVLLSASFSGKKMGVLRRRLLVAVETVVAMK